MNDTYNLVEWAKGIKQRFPQHRDQIWELIVLCMDETEEGGSPIQEIENCREAICQLVGIDE